VDVVDDDDEGRPLSERREQLARCPEDLLDRELVGRKADCGSQSSVRPLVVVKRRE
jgi:hypothetical protein